MELQENVSLAWRIDIGKTENTDKCFNGSVGARVIEDMLCRLTSMSKDSDIGINKSYVEEENKVDPA